MSPAKVVAGKEPEHTNLFLQALARAAAPASAQLLGGGRDSLQSSDDVAATPSGRPLQGPGKDLLQRMNTRQLSNTGA